MYPSRIVILAGMLSLGFVWPLRADVFVLRSGGKIEGELLNPDEEPRRTYLVSTSNGGKLKLPKEQVVEIRTQSEAERRYKLYLPKMPRTAEGNWIMAEWCRENGLAEQRKHHLEQILTHNADHKEARHALGFSRLGDEWVKADDWMVAQGYVKYKGSWRLKQEVQLADRQRKRDLAVKEWNQKLKMWRSWLMGRIGRKAEEARRSIAEIRDPLAATGLGLLLDNEDEPLAQKLMYIEKLGQLDCQAATNALLKCAMEDRSDQVRDACWDELARDGSPAVVASLTKELESKDNRRVRLAAIGLGRMDNPSAIPALIDALVTTHKYKIIRRGGNMGASFSRPGGGINPGGGLMAGGRGVEIVSRDHQNREVLDALVSLAEGANFHYSEESWRNWYARLNTPPNINLRRSQ
jgi:hypothetical protein